MPFEAGAKRKITQKMLSILEANMSDVNAMVKDEGKKAILDLKVYDTGAVYEDFNVRSWRKKDAIVIRMMNTVDHAIYPLLGLGSNRKKGPRNWFFLAADRILNKLGSRKLGRTAPQPPSYKELLSQGKGYTLKSSSKRVLKGIKPGKGFEKGTMSKKNGAYSQIFKPKT